MSQEYTAGKLTSISRGISMVVPTHGRAELVELLLASLDIARQRFQGLAEILVVDSSTRPSADAIEAHCQNYDAKYYRAENNVRVKRNLGIEQARYSVVFFVDSDCEVAPDALNEHMRFYDDALVGGVLGIIEFVGPKNWLWKVIEQTQFVHVFATARSQEEATWTPGTNVSYRRDLLRQASGFAIDLPFRLGGDDVDLGMRIREAGYPVQCNPDAVAYHTRSTWSGWRRLVERVFRWGRAQYHLLKRHPEKAFYDHPSLTVVFLLLVLLASVEAIVAWSLWPFIVPPLWWLAAFLLQSVLVVGTHKRKLRGFVFDLGGEVFYIVFEVGQIYESLRHGDVGKCLMRFMHTPRPYQGRRLDGAVKAWSVTAALAIVYSIRLWLANR